LEMGVSQTICLGWPWTMILPISVIQVARITGSDLYILSIGWLQFPGFSCRTSDCVFLCAPFHCLPLFLKTVTVFLQRSFPSFSLIL
jgi:hypothetical protein